MATLDSRDHGKYARSRILTGLFAPSRRAFKGLSHETQFGLDRHCYRLQDAADRIRQGRLVEALHGEECRPRKKRKYNKKP